MKCFFHSLLLVSLLFGMGIRGSIAHADDLKDIFNLPQLIDAVLERHPNILTARSQKAAADANIPVAYAMDDPEASLSQWSIPANLNILRADETWITLSQKFPGPGKRSLRKKSAELGSKRIDETIRETERDLITKTKQAYHDLLFAYKTLEINREQVALAEHLLSMANLKGSTGEAGPQDALRARMELISLSNVIIISEQKINLSAARINTLLGRPLETPLFFLVPPVWPKWDWPNFSLESLHNQAILSQPGIKTKALEIEQGKQAVHLAQKEFTPDFTVEGSYWEVQGSSNRWMASLQINLPWANKTKYEAMVREAREHQREEHARYEWVINETALKIKTLLVQIETEKQQVKRDEKDLLPIAREVLDAALLEYQANKGEMASVLEAQKREKMIELDYFRTLTEAKKDVAELERVVGLDLEKRRE